MSPFHRASLCIGLLIAFGTPVSAADNSAPTPSAPSIVRPDTADSTRAIPLEGALNVRDLGGLQGDQGAIPLNHFIRAANLAKLTPADREILYKHDVVLDIDLRTPGEELREPDALANDPHVRYVPISLFGNQPLMPPPTASQMPPKMPAQMSSLRDMYVNALAEDQPQFKQVFEAIAAAGKGAVLYHCTIGKDRTGMISAMLLELAGVSRAEIVHNYAVSSYYLQPMMNTAMPSGMGPRQPAMPGLMGSSPDSIEGFLDALEGRYGGTAAYLKTIGVSANDIAKIRARLAT